MNQTKVRCIVDTQNITLKTEDPISGDLMGCISHDGYESATRKAKAKISMYKQYAEEELDTLDKYMDRLNNKLKMLKIEECRMNRVDIAIDTNEYTFAKNLKMLLFIAELLTIRKIKNGDLWYNVDMRNLQAHCIKFNPKNNNSFELAIYNKAKEQQGFNYETRIEFRHKRLKGKIEDTEKWVKDTIDKLDGLEGRIEYVEQYMVARLTDLWELERNNVKSFSEFVRKYNNYFYTLNILKGVYSNAGLKGSYSRWLEKFRLTNELEFVSKSHIKKFVASSKKSVKAYLK